jgi:tetratricopeptide (TPR) repeat protein
LAALLIAYERQLESTTGTPDRSLLEAAKPLLEQRLKETVLDAETVRLGKALYAYLGNPEAVLQLLARYREQPLAPDEAAWTRWHEADNLAMLRRCEEAVEAQRNLYHWAMTVFPVGQSLWVMNDGTQAFCWVAIGQGTAWLDIFHDLMTRVGPTLENRLDRFYYLRTAAHVLMKLDRHDEALMLGDKIRDVANEDAEWEWAMDLRIEASALELHVYQHAGRTEDVRRVGLLAPAMLDEYERTRSPLSLAAVRRLCTLSHNLAAPLYLAQQYDLAIPLFRRAIRQGSTSPHTYLWLAASLWATTKQRTEVLPLLTQVAQRYPGVGQQYRQLPEFQDVMNDPQFGQAMLHTPA